MNPTMWITLAIGLVGSGCLGAWLIYLINKAKLPYENQTSAVQAATLVNATALATLARVDRELKEVQTEVTALSAHVKKQDTEIVTLRTHINTWVLWGEGLKINWPLLRLQEDAPPLPAAPNIHEGD